MAMIPLDLIVRWLSWILLHFVWQGAAIGGLLWIALKVVDQRASRTRYGLACGVLLVMTALPLVTGFVLSGDVRPVLKLSNPTMTSERSFPLEVPRSPAQVAILNADDVVDRPRQAQRAETLTWRKFFDTAIQRWSGMLVAVWLSGVTLFGTRMILSLYAVRRLRRSGVVVTDSLLTSTIRSLTERLKVRAGVQFMQTALVRVPLVLGWLRPVILIPVSLTSGLTIEQIEAVLAHELAHIKRHDYLVNVLQSLVETLLFYHPSVWWVSRMIRDEREHCCDAIALQAIGDRHVYAKALFELARQATQPMSLAVAVDGGRLADRIRRIMGLPAAKSVVAGPVAIVLAGLLLMFFVTASSLFRSAKATAEDQQAKLPEAEKKSDDEKEGTAPAIENVRTVVFVVAKHQLFHEGQIVTWDEIETIVDDECAIHGKIRPAFLHTNGGFQRIAKFPVNQLCKRLSDSKKLNGSVGGTISPRASARYDRIETPADFVMDESARWTGKVVDSDDKPLADAEIVLLPTEWPGGLSLSLRNARLRDPHDEHVVNSDGLGRFEVVVEPDEKLIVGIHPHGFVMTSLEKFERERLLRLQPWSCIHGSVYLKDDVTQSVNFSANRLNVLFNVAETPLAKDGTFDQKFLPPGSITVQRGIVTDAMFRYLFPVASPTLKPGESAEVNVGPIPDNQKKETLEEFERKRRAEETQTKPMSELKSGDNTQAVPAADPLPRVTFTVARNVLVHRRQFVTWGQAEQILNDACKQHGTIQPVFLLTRFCSDPSTKLAEIYARLSQKSRIEPFAVRHASLRISNRYDQLPQIPVVYADTLRAKGQVVDPDGAPQDNAEVLLLRSTMTLFPGDVSDRQGVDLCDGRLENPDDEYVVVSDAAGRFEIVAQMGEQILVGIHPRGFAIATIDEFKTDHILRLKPWSRVRWRFPQNAPPQHSIWIASSPNIGEPSSKIEPPTFNVWSKRSNPDGTFDEKFVVPGPVTIRRVNHDSRTVSSHLVSKQNLVSGETTEFDGEPFARQVEMAMVRVDPHSFLSSQIHWPSRKSKNPTGANHVAFILAQHVQLYDDQVVTWDEIEEILNKESDAHGVVTPVFVNTLGSAARQKEINTKRSQLYRRLFEKDRVDGVRSRVASTRASARYDRLRIAGDLVPLGSQMRTGRIVDVKGESVAGADVLLLPTANQNVAIHLWNGQLRDPHDEHRVVADARGLFSIRSEVEEEYLAAIHETGFCLMPLSSFTNDQSVKLEPWSRLHGTIAKDEDDKQSIHFVTQPVANIEFHTWDTEILPDRFFDQRFVPPGAIAVQRSVETQRGVTSYFTTQKLTMLSGQSESIRLGPIPPEQSPGFRLRRLDVDQRIRPVIPKERSSIFKKRTSSDNAAPELNGFEKFEAP
ncbi:M56 family metallopeptidase [Schlesneria paludicola]|uniref:M56 family metallopeptidase n=1 Tax=Schlesneria paludicola TaxID=360056 RepID=UPI000299DE7E|nr:M56 family metallopeptidase [Schlesneria paludicola]